jgi:PAS domain S-box-containing protein
MGTDDDITFVLNLEGRVRGWSRGAERIYGYPAGEALELHVDHLVPVQDRPHIRQLLDSAIGDGFARSPANRLARDGRAISVMTTATRFVDDRGRPTGIVNIDCPIANGHQVSLLTDLEAEIAMRDECLSIASHELRGPLSVLSLALDDLLQQGHPHRGDLDQKLELANRQATKISRLVGQLFDVSRFMAGATMHLERERVDLVEVADDLLDGLRDTMRRAGSEIDFRAPPSVRGFWDRLRIEQVLENLLGNALKFAPGKPIVLTMSSDPHHATVRLRDHGPGIPEADHERVFERFVRRAPKHVVGLGLGLYIVRSIVEAHGGAIHVEDAPKGGAEFVVTLPLEQPAPPGPP